MTNRRLFIIFIAILLAAVVLCIAAWAAASAATPCEDPDPCGAEPAQLPQLYLPAVLRSMPPMAWEYTPYVPAPTVTPERGGAVGWQ